MSRRPVGFVLAGMVRAVSARPTLVLEIALEGVPRVGVVASSFEDEVRLRQWLRCSDAIENARLALSLILDRLDELDTAA